MIIQKLRNLIAGKRGQGMTEYIIIVAVIAIAAISIYTIFGKQIRSGVAMLTGQLGGDISATQKYEGKNDATSDVNKKVTLKDVDNKQF